MGYLNIVWTVIYAILNIFYMWRTVLFNVMKLWSYTTVETIIFGTVKGYLEYCFKVTLCIWIDIGLSAIPDIE